MTGIVALLESGNWLSPTGGLRYLQLRRLIQSAVDDDILKENDPLPSEREIAANTDLSRVTVRKAVAALARDAVIVQRRGSGSFVAPRLKRVEQNLSRLTSFSEGMGRRGVRILSRWLERTSLPNRILPDPMVVTRSLYEIPGRSGNRPVRAIQRISAINLGPGDAGFLGVRPGAAGLSIERVSYKESGGVVKITRSIYRGDAYEFVAELKLTG